LRPTRAASVARRGFPTCGFGRCSDPGAADAGNDSFGSLRESERLAVPVRGFPIDGFRIA